MDLIEFVEEFPELHFLELPSHVLHGRDWLVGIVIQYLLGLAHNEASLRTHFVAYSNIYDGLRGRPIHANFENNEWLGIRVWVDRTGYLHYALTYTLPFVDDNLPYGRDSTSFTYSEARKQIKKKEENKIKAVQAFYSI